MKYMVNMSIQGRFTCEVDVPCKDERKIKEAADQMFAETDFGKLADIDAMFVNCERVDEEEENGEKVKLSPDEEMVNNWLYDFISKEIKETKGAIANERLWAMGGESEENPHHQNVVNKQAYLRKLRDLMDGI